MRWITATFSLLLRGSPAEAASHMAIVQDGTIGRERTASDQFPFSFLEMLCGRGYWPVLRVCGWICTSAGAREYLDLAKQPEMEEE
jgi:hypothetical protein